jgi:hypothetical protein
MNGAMLKIRMISTSALLTHELKKLAVALMNHGVVNV